MLPGVDVLSSLCHREDNHRHSGRSVHAAPTSPDQPRLSCCPCPHSSLPNHCLPTDTSRPFITFLTASVQPQQSRERGGKAEKKRPNYIFALSWKKKPTRTPRRTVWPQKAVEEQKSYLSTQRCSRVEVVGYSQHPQHRKT